MIATSEQEKQQLLAGGVEDQRVIKRNGIDAPSTLPEAGHFQLQWTIPKGAKVILFLGLIIATKRPDMLINAFSRWRARVDPGTTAFLVVAGPEEESSMIGWSLSSYVPKRIGIP